MLQWTQRYISFFELVFLYSLEQISISRRSRSYSSSLLNFLRNLHTVFHGSCTKLHSHQQCMKILCSPYPCHHLVFLAFFIIAVLIGMRWHLIVVSICISLVISDVEHLFMCLLAICMSSLAKYLIKGEYPKYIKNSSNSTTTSTPTTIFKNGQKSWIDSFPKETYKWICNSQCIMVFGMIWKVLGYNLLMSK